MNVYKKLFQNKHIGPNDIELSSMLSLLQIQNLDELTYKIIPKSIFIKKELNLDSPLSEEEVVKKCKTIGGKNQLWRNFIGMGFHPCSIPFPIIRNVLENPGWYTPYTPYQSEIAQGRLECLFNFQTLVSELTQMPIANSSLLDEASAGAEALAMAYRINKRTKFLLHNKCHPQTLAVIKTRAKFLGFEIVVVDAGDMVKHLNSTVCGAILQYPDTEGHIAPNIYDIIEMAHKHGCIVSVATDILSLCLLEPPGALGADIAFGSSQRFGNPLGFGGPHAAYFACGAPYLRYMPGRIVGQSQDKDGNVAYRLALQTREQHIKRERATSNICTAQALLANMSALYAIYHGPKTLLDMASYTHSLTRLLHQGLNQVGHIVEHNSYFDTLKVISRIGMKDIKVRAKHKKINLRYYPDGGIGIALNETVSADDIKDVFEIFSIAQPLTYLMETLEMDSKDLSIQNPRKSAFLTQEVFNRYHSETEFMRYVKRLENKDISLTNAMIPLGSCTMKLNAACELMPLSWPEFAAIHPYAPSEQVEGYVEIIKQLDKDLCEITGFDAISFQSNSGAQGEYAGLCTIRSYLTDKGEAHRKVCLIPKSSHGTNFSSAALAGMKIVELNTDKNGFLEAKDFDACLEEHSKNIACLMITYPSTHGSFDPNIKEICDKIHIHGGLVYMDGANMNAQIGLCRPGDFGADICHLNLHKTFCIPHGGGGPGMGPIAVKSMLTLYLPELLVSNGSNEISASYNENSSKSMGSISASAYGSALILLIPWAYIKLMGAEGLKKASQTAILNANYTRKRLQTHYDMHQSNTDQLCGHEFLVDLNRLRQKTGIEAMDVAKRLQDYNFHAPTVAWPVPSCLMIEPTESEGMREIDRFCEAMISIRQEIEDIVTGKYTKTDNPLKNAPHTQAMVINDTWNHPYSKVTAAFPMGDLRHNKVWPSVGRIDEIYGDKNPRCTIPK